MPRPVPPWLNAAVAFQNLLLFALAATAIGRSVCVVLDGFTRRNVLDLCNSLAALVPPDKIDRLPKGTRVDLVRDKIDSLRVILCLAAKESAELAVQLALLGDHGNRTRPLILCVEQFDCESLPGHAVSVNAGAVGGDEGFEWVLRSLKQQPQVCPPPVTCALPVAVTNALDRFEQSAAERGAVGRARRSREAAEALVRGAAVYRLRDGLKPEDTVEASARDYAAVRTSLQTINADSTEVDVKPDAAALFLRLKYFNSGRHAKSVTVKLLEKLGNPRSPESDSVLQTWCALHAGPNAPTKFQELGGRVPPGKVWAADPAVLKSYLREISPKMIRSHLAALLRDELIEKGPKLAHGAQTYVFPDDLPHSACLFDQLAELRDDDASPPAQSTEPSVGGLEEGQSPENCPEQGAAE